MGDGGDETAVTVLPGGLSPRSLVFNQQVGGRNHFSMDFLLCLVTGDGSQTIRDGGLEENELGHFRWEGPTGLWSSERGTN